MTSKTEVSKNNPVCTGISDNEWASMPTPTIHPEEQILQIVRENKTIPLGIVHVHFFKIQVLYKSEKIVR